MVDDPPELEVVPMSPQSVQLANAVEELYLTCVKKCKALDENLAKAAAAATADKIFYDDVLSEWQTVRRRVRQPRTFKMPRIRKSGGYTITRSRVRVPGVAFFSSVDCFLPGRSGWAGRRRLASDHTNHINNHHDIWCFQNREPVPRTPCWVIVSVLVVRSSMQ